MGGEEPSGPQCLTTGCRCWFSTLPCLLVSSFPRGDGRRIAPRPWQQSRAGAETFLEGLGTAVLPNGPAPILIICSLIHVHTHMHALICVEAACVVFPPLIKTAGVYTGPIISLLLLGY